MKKLYRIDGKLIGSGDTVRDICEAEKAHLEGARLYRAHLEGAHLEPHQTVPRDPAGRPSDPHF